MELDYKESELFDYFLHYEKTYHRFEADYSEKTSRVEYARGGETLHRGFYCPSPILDIIIGGVNRGHLIKRQKDHKAIDYAFHKDENGRLVIADKYEKNLYSHTEPRLHLREYLIEEANRIVAPVFSIQEIDHPIVFLSLCDYDESGRLLSYRTMLPGYKMTRGGAKANIQASCFFTETYQYDNDQGWLLLAKHGEFMGGSARESCYCFFHDGERRLAAYQSIRNNEKDAVRNIPLSKRRIV